jgi:hypothetical protein
MPEPLTEQPVAVPPDATEYVTVRPEVEVVATEGVPVFQGAVGLVGAVMV